MKLSTLALLCTLTAAEKRNIVDLSVDLETSSLDNPGAKIITETASRLPEIRTALVLEHGKIVAEYARNDVNPNAPFPVWSITKSWTSLLVGQMMEANLVFLHETLGDIWSPDEAVWMNMTDASERQNITIEALLTMTSGLVFPEYLRQNIDWDDGGNDGGASLEDALSFPPLLGEVGVHSYLSSSNIFSYIIEERTGMSPREYASKTVFPALGIEDTDIDWWQNQDGIEYTYSGLLLTARQMAKFGQLYLQEGLWAPNQALVSADWAVESTSLQVEASMVDPATNTSMFNGYGYLFWVTDFEKMGYPGAGTMYCALGQGGQDICVYPALDRVAVQQREWEDLSGSGIMASVALDENLSFENPALVIDSNDNSSRSSKHFFLVWDAALGLLVALFLLSS